MFADPFRFSTHACSLSLQQSFSFSKFIAPTSAFLSFGTEFQTGNNPGTNSQQKTLRNELLRAREGRPAETSSGNIGKEGLENPLGGRGALSSYVTGESFLNDSRHGEQFQFPGFGARSGGKEPPPARVAGGGGVKENVGGGGGEQVNSKRRNPFLTVPGSRIPTAEVKNVSSPALIRGNSESPASPSASQIQPWEASQHLRWKQHEDSQAKLREEINTKHNQNARSCFESSSDGRESDLSLRDTKRRTVSNSVVSGGIIRKARMIKVSIIAQLLYVSKRDEN